MAKAAQSLPMAGDREIFAMHADGAAAAVALFANQGFHSAARAFGLTHERAVQYLSQAPVMVFAAGVGADFRASALYMQHRLHSSCVAGIKLPALMRSLGYPLPLRKLLASALVPSHAQAVKWLSRTSPSVLGRVIPAKSGQQRQWLNGLTSWLASFERRSSIPSQAHFDWMAEQVALHRPAKGEPGDMADFMVGASRRLGDAEFNLDWQWPRAVEEMNLWHDRLTCERMLRGTPFNTESVIDTGHHPDTFESMDFEFVALRTPSEIVAEGKQMRHCVASYIPRIIKGDCHIVSIRKRGARAVTLELSKTWRVVQVKRRFNAIPSQLEHAAAMFYAELMKAKAS